MIKEPFETDERYIIRRDAQARQELLDAGYDGIDVLVMSVVEVSQYEPGEDEVCISITSHWNKNYPPNLSDKFVDVLKLQFDDVDYGDFKNEDAKPLSGRKAEEVIRFVQKHLDKKRIVIHCF